MMSTGTTCRLALALLVVFITVFTPAPAYTPRPPPYVCKNPLPTSEYRRILTRNETSTLVKQLREFTSSWVKPKYRKKVTFKFATRKRSRCKGRKCPKGKRDTADKAQSRQTRSVKPCRKDYRQLTKNEMNKFHKALQKLKQGGIYDALVDFHNPGNSPGAHNGAAFLPWHREYLYQLEQAMRALGKRYKKVTVPFWDSCMDQSLPDPRDCVVWWTKKFWGRGNGVVNNGKLAKNWDVTDDCTNIDSQLFRAYTGNPNSLLTREKIADDILPSATFTELALYSPFESYHGQKHVYVGGHLRNLPCAPNDPIFFLLHGMIDCIWEEWIESGNINVYPPDGTPGLGGEVHEADAPMSPFPGLKNIDGFWDGYTCCAQRPSKIKCLSDADCDSPQDMLFCHQCQCHCKVREDGNCNGLPDNACYCEKKHQNPQCFFGTCQCN